MSQLKQILTNFRTGFSNLLPFLCAVLMSGLFCAPTYGQTYYNMASGNYSETFTAWTGYGTNWNAVPVNATGAVPSATRTTGTSASLTTSGTGTSIGYDLASSTKLLFLSTGATDNTTSIATDLNLNFTGRTPGSLTFDAATVFNSTGNRVGVMRVYYSLDGGTTWAGELSGTNLPYTATNNVVGSGSVSVTLPAGLENQASVKFRFYYHNGPTPISPTPAGSRPKISIDNVTVSSTPSVLPPSPTINVVGTFSKFYGNDGLGSETQSVTVGGTALTNNIVIGPLSGFEFSTSPSGPFSSSLTLNQISGTVATTTVYVKVSSSSLVGTYSGNIDFVSSPATTVQRSVTGQIYSNGSAFTTGNILTLRVGEVGGTTLTTNSAPVFIDEYTTTGTFVQSVPMPFINNGLNRKFTMSGTSTTEGFLNLSPDGQYLTFGGYDAIPGISGIGSTTASSTNRIVARVTQNGSINTTTRISDGYDGASGTIRSAATVDGTSFWTGGAGTGGGARYVTLGSSTSTQVSSTPANTRGTAIYNSQLYTSSQSGTNIGINTVGTGLPTTTGNTHTILSGTTSGTQLLDPRGFVFCDVDDNGTPDVLYVADASATSTQGLVKFSNTGGVWTKRGNLPNPSGRSIHGIGYQVVGGNRVLYICLGTISTPANEIYKFTDVSAVTSNITSSGTEIITACGSPIITSTSPTTMLFKGVSFAPVNVPTPTIAHTFTTPVSTAAQGTSQPIYSVQLDITDGNALLTGLTVQTAGAYASSDFTSFKLVVSTNSTYEVTDPVISTISTSTGPGQTLGFTGLGQNLPVGTTRYLFVVASVSGCASVGNSINITSTPLSSISYSNPSSVKTGTPVGGSTVTTSAGSLDDVSSPVAVGGQPTVQLSWTNPACVSQIVIVAHTSSITGTPSGTYFGNTNFTAAPGFLGGGRVVYTGTSSPQVITGLTLNQQYFFKIFVKFGTQYSPGVEVTATPTLVNIYSRGSGLSHTDSIWSLSPTGPKRKLTDIGGMNTTRGLVIQNGDVVQLSSSGGSVVCRELIVNQGGTLIATGTTTSDNKFLYVYGDITNNGVIGTGATYNPICFGLEGNIINFNGTGVSDVGRMRKNTVINQQTTLFINSDVTVRFTGGAGIYSNVDNSTLNTFVNSGKTLNLIDGTTDFALDGFDGTATGQRSGSLTVNGTMYVGGTLFTRNNNTTPGYSCSISTGIGGIIQVGNLLTDISAGQGTSISFGSTSKVNVIGSLTVTSGSLNSNGAITLKSTPTSTARVANSTGTISGLITSERYVANDGWHLTGTVFPSQTITDWNDDIWTQGPMPGVRLFNGGYNTSTIFEYDQNNDDVIPYVGGTTKGWIVPITSNIEQYKGYRVSVSAGKTLDNSGVYSMNPSPFSLSYNPSSAYPGWNLITNPHLSAVNTGGFTWGTGVQQVVVIWNPITNQYQYSGTLGGLTGVTLNSSITPIASGQAFFVKCTQPSTLTIPQTAKAASSGTFFRTATENQPNALEIRIKNENSELDATILQFVEGSDVGYETNLDAFKMMNPNLNVYTISNNDKLAINGMPGGDETVIVPLGYRVAQSGVYGFQLDGISLLNGYDKIYLKDLFNGTITDLTTQTFVFDSESGEFNSRFELVFTNSTTSIDNLIDKTSIKVYPNPVISDKFSIDVDDKTNEVQVVMTDIVGRVITTGFYKSNHITINKPNTSGQYFIKVQTPKTSMTKTLYVK
jgi:hypothetical protein